MIKVYSAQHPAEAEYLHNMLISHHIHSHLGGSFFLLGRDDGLPPHEMVTLYTDPADFEQARELIQSSLVSDSDHKLKIL